MPVFVLSLSTKMASAALRPRVSRRQVDVRRLPIAAWALEALGPAPNSVNAVESSTSAEDFAARAVEICCSRCICSDLGGDGSLVRLSAVHFGAVRSAIVFLCRNTIRHA